MGYTIGELIRRDLIERNMHRVIMFVGAGGSGKSWAALRIAYEIDPKFKIDNVVFNYDQFLKLVNSDRLRAGSVMIWDEVGTGVSTRNFYTEQNKAISNIFQIIRHRNLAIIFTAPDLKFLDSHPRSMLSNIVEMKNINRNNGYSEVRWTKLDRNIGLNTTYAKLPKARVDGRPVSSSILRVKRPPARLVNSYEQRAADYKHGLTTREELKQEKRQEDNEKNSLSISELVKRVLINVGAVTKTFRNGRTMIVSRLIEAHYNIGGRKANQVKTLVEAQLSNTHGNTSHLKLSKGGFGKFSQRNSEDTITVDSNKEDKEAVM